MALSVKAEALIVLSLQNHITSSQSRLLFNKLEGICGRSKSAKSLGVVCDDLLGNDEVADRQQIDEGVADLVDLFLIARQLQHNVVVTLHRQHDKLVLQGLDIGALRDKVSTCTNHVLTSKTHRCNLLRQIFCTEDQESAVAQRQEEQAVCRLRRVVKCSDSLVIKLHFPYAGLKSIHPGTFQIKHV